MKTSNVGIWLLALTALTASGCARPHGLADYRGADGDYMVDRGVKEMMNLVEKTVEDPEKAKRVQAVIADIVAEVKHSNQLTRQFHRQLYELNGNYEATPEQFTKILDDLNNNRMRAGAKILGLRFKMKEMLTAQEWKALTEGMDMSRARYRHGRGGSEGSRD